MIENVDGDERQSFGLGLEAMDDLENLALNMSALNKDGDEMQQASLGVVTSEYLENLDITGTGQTKDGDKWSKTDLSLGYKDTLDSLHTGVNNTNVNADERTNFGIKFSFED